MPPEDKMVEGKTGYQIGDGWWIGITEPQKEVPIRFVHPNREMFRNQLGMFLTEFLIEYESTHSNKDKDLEALIEKKINEFILILEGKRGF